MGNACCKFLGRSETYSPGGKTAPNNHSNSRNNRNSKNSAPRSVFINDGFNENIDYSDLPDGLDLADNARPDLNGGPGNVHIELNTGAEHERAVDVPDEPPRAGSRPTSSGSNNNNTLDIKSKTPAKDAGFVNAAYSREQPSDLSDSSSASGHSPIPPSRKLNESVKIDNYRPQTNEQNSSESDNDSLPRRMEVKAEISSNNLKHGNSEPKELSFVNGKTHTGESPATSEDQQVTQKDTNRTFEVKFSAGGDRSDSESHSSPDISDSSRRKDITNAVGVVLPTKNSESWDNRRHLYKTADSWVSEEGSGELNEHDQHGNDANNRQPDLLLGKEQPLDLVVMEKVEDPTPPNRRSFYSSHSDSSDDDAPNVRRGIVNMAPVVDRDTASRSSVQSDRRSISSTDEDEGDRADMDGKAEVGVEENRVLEEIQMEIESIQESLLEDMLTSDDAESVSRQIVEKLDEISSLREQAEVEMPVDKCEECLSTMHEDDPELGSEQTHFTTQQEVDDWYRKKMDELNETIGMELLEHFMTEKRDEQTIRELLERQEELHTYYLCKKIIGTHSFSPGHNPLDERSLSRASSESDHVHGGTGAEIEIRQSPVLQLKKDSPTWEIFTDNMHMKNQNNGSLSKSAALETSGWNTAVRSADLERTSPIVDMAPSPDNRTPENSSPVPEVAEENFWQQFEHEHQSLSPKMLLDKQDPLRLVGDQHPEQMIPGKGDKRNKKQMYSYSDSDSSETEELVERALSLTKDRSDPLPFNVLETPVSQKTISFTSLDMVHPADAETAKPQTATSISAEPKMSLRDISSPLDFNVLQTPPPRDSPVQGAVPYGFDSETYDMDDMTMEPLTLVQTDSETELTPDEPRGKPSNSAWTDDLQGIVLDYIPSTVNTPDEKDGDLLDIMVRGDVEPTEAHNSSSSSLDVNDIPVKFLVPQKLATEVPQVHPNSGETIVTNELHDEDVDVEVYKHIVTKPAHAYHTTSHMFDDSSDTTSDDVIDEEDELGIEAVRGGPESESDTDTENVIKMYDDVLDQYGYAEELDLDSDGTATLTSDEDDSDLSELEAKQELRDTLKEDISSNLPVMTADDFKNLMTIYRTERQSIRKGNDLARIQLGESLWAKLQHRKTQVDKYTHEGVAQAQAQAGTDRGVDVKPSFDDKSVEIVRQELEDNLNSSVTDRNNVDQAIQTMDQRFVKKVMSAYPLEVEQLLAKHFEDVERLRRERDQTAEEHQQRLLQKLKEHELSEIMGKYEHEIAIQADLALQKDVEMLDETYLEHISRLIGKRKIDEEALHEVMEEYRQNQRELIQQREQAKVELTNTIEEKLKDKEKRKRQSKEVLKSQDSLMSNQGSSSLQQVISKFDEDFYTDLLARHAAGDLDEEEMGYLIDEHIGRVNNFKKALREKMIEKHKKQGAKMSESMKKKHAVELIEAERQDAEVIKHVREEEKVKLEFKLQSKLRDKSKHTQSRDQLRAASPTLDDNDIEYEL